MKFNMTLYVLAFSFYNIIPKKYNSFIHCIGNFSFEVLALSLVSSQPQLMFIVCSYL